MELMRRIGSWLGDVTARELVIGAIGSIIGTLTLWLLGRAAGKVGLAGKALAHRLVTADAKRRAYYQRLAQEAGAAVAFVGVHSTTAILLFVMGYNFAEAAGFEQGSQSRQWVHLPFLLMSVGCLVLGIRSLIRLLWFYFATNAPPGKSPVPDDEKSTAGGG